MKLHPLLEHVNLVFHMMDRNNQVSKFTQGRSALDILRHMREETLELEDEIIAGDDHMRQDELGDCISGLALLLAKMPTDVEPACNMVIEKFRRRKPWMFEDYEGPVPQTAEEEHALWNATKKLEKEGT